MRKTNQRRQQGPAGWVTDRKVERGPMRGTLRIWTYVRESLLKLMADIDDPTTTLLIQYF